MEINVSDTGEVTGSYVNRAPGYCAQPNESFPLLGWTNGTLVTFAVNWERCNSLTSWIGNYNRAEDTIIAPWTLIYRTYSGVDQDEDVDTFSRQCD